MALTFSSRLATTGTLCNYRRSFIQKNVHISKKMKYGLHSFLVKVLRLLHRVHVCLSVHQQSILRCLSNIGNFRLLYANWQYILCPQKVVPSQMFLNRTLKVVILLEGRDHSLLYLEVYCSSALSTVTYNFHLYSILPGTCLYKEESRHLYGCQR